MVTFWSILLSVASLVGWVTGGDWHYAVFAVVFVLLAIQDRTLVSQDRELNEQHARLMRMR